MISNETLTYFQQSNLTTKLSKITSTFSFISEVNEYSTRAFQFTRSKRDTKLHLKIKWQKLKLGKNNKTKYDNNMESKVREYLSGKNENFPWPWQQPISERLVEFIQESLLWMTPASASAFNCKFIRSECKHFSQELQYNFVKNYNITLWRNLHWMHQKSESSTLTSSNALKIEPAIKIFGTILYFGFLCDTA